MGADSNKKKERNAPFLKRELGNWQDGSVGKARKDPRAEQQPVPVTPEPGRAETGGELNVTS